MIAYCILIVLAVALILVLIFYHPPESSRQMKAGMEYERKEKKMALSDYLTSEEWDACFYLNFGKHQAPTFGESMHKTIDYLIGKGYHFAGLTEIGGKKVQVDNGVNAPKICIWLGNPYHCNLSEILTNGRNFLKVNAPELIDETEEEWEQIIREEKEHGTKTH